MIVLNKLIHYGSFREQDSILKEKFEKLKEQLTVVVRLFVIMGIKFLYSIYITIYIAGVPFILELVTSVIAHEYGMDATCYLTMSVDTLNLLSVGTLKADTLIFVLVITHPAGCPHIPGHRCQEVGLAELEGEGHKL